MKVLLLTTSLFFVQFAIGQSKKEQIINLTLKVDSLKAIVSQLNANLSQLQNQQNKLYDDNNLLVRENSSAKNNLNERESTITNLNASLLKKENEITGLKDSLDLVYSNNQILPLIKSSTYAGEYSFEFEDGPAGFLQLYFDGKEDYYFLLEYVKGPPSYNMGTLEGIMKIYGNIGVFAAKMYDVDFCKVVFVFDDNGVHVKQYTSDSDCGFGGNVYINQYYYQNNTENKPVPQTENSSGKYTKSTNKL
jgi:hypothetical protein